MFRTKGTWVTLLFRKSFVRYRQDYSSRLFFFQKLPCHVEINIKEILSIVKVVVECLVFLSDCCLWIEFKRLSLIKYFIEFFVNCFFLTKMSRKKLSKRNHRVKKNSRIRKSWLNPEESGKTWRVPSPNRRCRNLRWKKRIMKENFQNRIWIITVRWSLKLYLEPQWRERKKRNWKLSETREG